jgi:hypothetical protein
VCEAQKLTYTTVVPLIKIDIAIKLYNNKRIYTRPTSYFTSTRGYLLQIINCTDCLSVPSGAFGTTAAQ